MKQPQFQFNPRNMVKLCNNAVDFIFDTGVSVAAFCRHCDISTSGFYQWTRGEMKLSDKKATTMNTYLKQFGYNAF